MEEDLNQESKFGSQVDEALDEEESAEYANERIDALINVLIKKGVVSEEELNSEFEELFDEDDESEIEEQD